MLYEVLTCFTLLVSVYLTVLVRSRMGECPLLESSVVLYEVRFDAFVGTIDYVLAPLRYIYVCIYIYIYMYIIFLFVGTLDYVLAPLRFEI